MRYSVRSLTQITQFYEFLELFFSRNSLIRYIRVDGLYDGENSKKSDAGNFITRATLKSYCYEIRKLELLFLTIVPSMFLRPRRLDRDLI